jgi:hypothetical protein
MLIPARSISSPPKNSTVAEFVSSTHFTSWIWSTIRLTGVTAAATAVPPGDG